jgi:hypothetical protein
MNRIIKTAAIAAIAAIGVIGLAGTANADVAVDSNGYGHVDKSDAHNLLGGDDRAFQAYASSVTFTATSSQTIDNEIQCGKYVRFDLATMKPVYELTGTKHVINTTPVTQTVTATMTTGGNGKINGWDLKGLGAPVYGPVTSVTEGTCPAGSSDIGTLSQTPSSTPTALKVTKPNSPVFDLPNTPAPVV